MRKEKNKKEDWEEEFDEIKIYNQRIWDTLDYEQKKMFYGEMKQIKSFISEQIEKAYLRGFEENKEAYVKEVERRAYQKGLHENTSGVIEHCSIPDCPECNMEAYNAGYDKSQEEIGVALRNFVDKLKKGLLNE